MPARRAGAVVAGGGLVTTLSLLDWPGLLALLAATAMVVGATCWVLSDQDRPKRLALLIRSWRAPTHLARPGARPVARRPSTARTRTDAQAAGTVDGR
ncbi:hypothetical protein ABNF97_08505 [Plantactinospora sp. B6F1]|uniref:hypothetical protein n=1 Tax=Plantactinospora sp. B6F1 TaxID=3158971 RepID=UPI00102AF152